VYKPLSLL